MTTTDTTAPAAPFGDFVVTLLLAGPGAVRTEPRDSETKVELGRAWGRHGERAAATWLEHEGWLRQAAVERGIRPMFRGRFFGEAIAAQKGTR